MKMYDAPKRKPRQHPDARLVRKDRARSALEDIIETIDILEQALEEAPKKDAAISRELRELRRDRLEMEDRIDKESGGLWFPEGWTKDEILDRLDDMRVRAESLPD